MLNRSYIQGHERHPHYLTDSEVLKLQSTINFSAEEEESVRIIRNLSDPTKLKIYMVLYKTEEISVTDLTQILNLSQSAVSHALADLKNLGLVESHRCGQLICYSLKRESRKKSFLSFLKQVLN